MYIYIIYTYIFIYIYIYLYIYIYISSETQVRKLQNYYYSSFEKTVISSSLSLPQNVL